MQLYIAIGYIGGTDNRVVRSITADPVSIDAIFHLMVATCVGHQAPVEDAVSTVMVAVIRTLDGSCHSVSL